MLRGALDFPTRGPHGTRALLVATGWLVVLAGLVLAGGVFFPLVGLALVPLVLVRGYYLRALRGAVASPSEPPRFGRLYAPLTDGLRSLALTIGYLLPAVLLIGAAVASGSVSLPDPTVEPTATPTVARDSLSGLALLFGLLWAIVAWFLLPAAATRLAVRDRVLSAFHLRSVVRTAATEDYVVGWVLSVLLQTVTLVLGSLLTPLLVGPFVFAFGNVAVRYVYGQSYLNAAAQTQQQP